MKTKEEKDTENKLDTNNNPKKQLLIRISNNSLKLLRLNPLLLNFIITKKKIPTWFPKITKLNPFLKKLMLALNPNTLIPNQPKLMSNLNLKKPM